jgi:hypothetical protein
MAAIPQQETTLAAIDRAIEQEAVGDGLRAHLGASVIGEPCERKLWQIFRWVGAEAKSGRMHRLLDRGAREEEALIRWLRKAGAEVWDKDPATGKQFRVSAVAGHFGGSLDGVVQGLVEAPDKAHVLELKTANARSFAKVAKDGVEKAQKNHFFQMGVYMELMDIDRAYYMVVCKNDDTLHAERIRRQHGVATQALKKAERIIASDRPLPKISDDPTWHECKPYGRLCDFHALCHGDARPLVNCRTCLHSTPEMDGDARWSCARHGKDLSEAEQRAGCEQHLYLPDLLRTWADQVDAQDDNVYYVQRETGNRFANGPDGYASAEIAAAADVRAIGDAMTDTLRAEFGGRVVG